MFNNKNINILQFNIILYNKVIVLYSNFWHGKHVFSKFYNNFKEIIN
jgi:hypothetical protein